MNRGLEQKPAEITQPEATWRLSLDIRALSACLLFCAIKLALLDFRFGDGNAYLYDAYLLSQGAVPYRDFLHADFPVQIGLLALLRPFFTRWIMGYHMVPICLEALTAYLLFLILQRRGNQLAWLAPVIHLFTFTVLSTSDFITGVQMTSCLTVLGWYLHESDHPFATGVAFALSFLTKMYTLPAAAIFGIFDLIQRRIRPALTLLAGTLMTVVVVLTPFLILAFTPMIEQTVLLHFNRPAGLNKSDVLLFFTMKEWALIFAAMPGLWLCRKQALVPAFAVTAMFFLLFRDLYFVYLDFMMPFLIIFALTFINNFWSDGKTKRRIAIAFLLGIAANTALSNAQYFQHFQKLGHFSNAGEIAANVSKLQPPLDLYGSHEVTPLVALLSDRPIFQNHADTNTQAFAAGTLDRQQISDAAVRSGVYMLARITHAPDLGYLDVGYQGFFSQEMFADSCQRALTFPSTSRETDNQIVVYKCIKNN